jgi:hypothetical protein
MVGAAVADAGRADGGDAGRERRVARGARPALHATGVIAAALVYARLGARVRGRRLVEGRARAIEAVLAYGLAWLAIRPPRARRATAAPRKD